MITKIKFFKNVTLLVLMFSIFLSTQTFAASYESMNNITVNENIKVTSREATKEEVLQNLVETKNMSYEEAEKFLNLNKTNSLSLFAAGSTVYRYFTIEQEIGPTAKVEAWAYCELYVYNSFRQINRIINTGNGVIGVTVDYWNGSTSAALPSSPSTNLNLSCRGYLTIKVDASVEGKFKPFGFEVGVRVGSSVYMSKQITFGKTLSIY